MVFDNRLTDSQKGTPTLQELVSAAVAGLSAWLSRAGEPPKTETTENTEPRQILLFRQALAVEKALRLGIPISAAYGLMDDQSPAKPPIPPPPPTLAAAPPPVAGPAVDVASPPPPTTPEPPARTLKVPGGLLAAGILREGLTDAFAFWCVAYNLDIDHGALACGWVTLAEVKDVLMPLMGDDRFYRLLRAAAKGGFVTRARRRDGTPVIYYRARLKLGEDFGLDSLGEPVRLPFEWVAAADDWKAALFTAVHVGRARNLGPISRATLRAITGLPAYTQRLYEDRTGITPQENLCVSYLPAQYRDLCERPGCFIYFNKEHFNEKNDTKDKEKSKFVAWHLPNSYSSPATCTRARSGMNRDHNRRLRHRNLLLNGGGQGGGRDGDMPRFPRIFWPDVQAAESARDKVKPDQPGVPSVFTPDAPEIDRFAISKWKRGVTRAGRGLWQLVPQNAPAMFEVAVVDRRLQAVMTVAPADVGRGTRQNA